MKNVFTDYVFGTDPLIVEFDRLRYCSEREQLKTIKALEDNGKIKVNWQDDSQEVNITFTASGHEIKSFKINKKQPL